MKVYSYVIARDYGFAPNPFHGKCTLATCKPKIRKKAEIGDWIIGTGSKAEGLQQKLIYAMKVTEKITFQKYWEDQRFLNKKPLLNGSLVQVYGDNIYWKDKTDKWHQENSHHSLEDGSINTLNLKKDVSGQFVLVSNHFYYFGKEAINIPPELISQTVKKGQGHKKVNSQTANILIQFLAANYQFGYHGDPANFSNFERYDGK